MFTGIVEEIGVLKETSSDYLTFGASKVLEGMKAGDSIAVNGVCLTVTFLNDHDFRVDVMPETLRCTNLGELRYGDQVNLERAVAMGGRIGGHLVLGHVDNVGRVERVILEGIARIIRIEAPAELMPYMVGKGFIAIDGVSLTIAELNGLSFTVSLVTYTLEHTILGNKKPGNLVNLEADIVAKYVERFRRQRDQGLTFDVLREYGFVKGEF